MLERRRLRFCDENLSWRYWQRSRLSPASDRLWWVARVATIKVFNVGKSLVKIYLRIIVTQLLVLAIAVDNLGGWRLYHDGRALSISLNTKCVFPYGMGPTTMAVNGCLKARTIYHVFSVYFGSNRLWWKLVAVPELDMHWIHPWIGLDWVRILRKLCGLDCIGSDDCNPLFFFIYIFSILTTDKRWRCNTIMCILADFNRLWLDCEFYKTLRLGSIALWHPLI